MSNTFYNSNTDCYYLAHYGVKGMKWRKHTGRRLWDQGVDDNNRRYSDASRAEEARRAALRAQASGTATQMARGAAVRRRAADVHARAEQQRKLEAQNKAIAANKKIEAGRAAYAQEQRQKGIVKNLSPKSAATKRAENDVNDPFRRSMLVKLAKKNAKKAQAAKKAKRVLDGYVRSGAYKKSV